MVCLIDRCGRKMASFMAQMLDELMGRDRNANPDEKKTEIKFDNAEVCMIVLCEYTLDLC